MYFKSVYEEIAALYLRLNGFLVNPCYVVEAKRGHSREIDLIAYRPRGAAETLLNSQELPPDPLLINDMHKPVGTHSDKLFEHYNIAVIGDVKSMKVDLWRNHSESEVGYALRLLGINGDKAKQLIANGHLNVGNTFVYLIGFARDNANMASEPPRREKPNIQYLFMPLEHVVEFIINRIKEHLPTKRRARAKYYHPAFEIMLLLTELKFLGKSRKSSKPEAATT